MFDMFSNYRNKFENSFKKYLLGLSKTRSRSGLYTFLDTNLSIIPRDSKVLTVGAGGDIGDYILRHAAINGFEVISFDIDDARKPDVLGDICTTDLPSSNYDAVILCEVLEHLHSPHLALDNIYNSLKPGGKLIVSVPFCLPIHDRPRDYFRFTRYGLELLLNRYQKITITERNTYFDAIDVIWMRIIMDNPSINVYISGLILPFVYYLKRPITLLLGRLIPLTGLTTGYIATAIK